MSVASRFRSLLLRLLFSPRATRFKRCWHETRRRILRRPHRVSVFLQLDDPYSYLLSIYLPRLAKQYDIDLRLHLSQARSGDYQPAPELLAEYAVDDCSRLARELGIAFLDKGRLPPTEHRVALSATLASMAGSDGFELELYQALAAYWRGDTAKAAEIGSAGGTTATSTQIVGDSQELQRTLGHYNSAMLHYAGEWYWGVDRLHYLLNRLDELGATRNDATDSALKSISQSMQVSLPIKPPAAASELPPIEFFHSPRSPYSYLSLQRTYEIADAFGLRLQLRPVMPMVMRGMKVPLQKLKYIAMDTAREAERLGIPYGRLADPVGAGTERLFAVFQYAQEENKGREFLLNAGRAIWAEAVDIATDAGMRKVSRRTGLFWPDVVAAMQSDDWRESIEANRVAMMRAGSWGVPTLRMGEFVLWGRDRDWALVRHIEELCDAGDGILV